MCARLRDFSSPFSDELASSCGTPRAQCNATTEVWLQNRSCDGSHCSELSGLQHVKSDKTSFRHCSLLLALYFARTTRRGACDQPVTQGFGRAKGRILGHRSGLIPGQVPSNFCCHLLARSRNLFRVASHLDDHCSSLNYLCQLCCNCHIQLVIRPSRNWLAHL